MIYKIIACCYGRMQLVIIFIGFLVDIYGTCAASCSIYIFFLGGYLLLKRCSVSVFWNFPVKWFLRTNEAPKSLHLLIQIDSIKHLCCNFDRIQIDY